MKHLISIFTVLILFTLGLSAQDRAESFEAYLTERFHETIGKQAARFKQDSSIVHAVVLAYMYDDSAGKLDTFVIETEKGATFRGTGWQVINGVAKYMSIVSKSRRNCSNNIECWRLTYFNDIDVIPEHPGVNPDRVLQDMGGYFKEVDRVEDPEPEVIIIDDKTISATCDENNKSSLCQWMKDQKEKANKGIERIKAFTVQETPKPEQKTPKLEQPGANVEQLEVTRPDSVYNEVWQRNEPVEVYYTQQIMIEEGESGAILAQIDMSIEQKNYTNARYKVSQILEKITSLELYESKLASVRTP